MKIACITLARTGASEYENYLLPLQLLAIVGDLIDAGHNVHWIDESLHTLNENKIVQQVTTADPEVLFFAGLQSPEKTLMASIAVKSNCIVGNEFISEDVMRPAQHWCDTLSLQNISIDLLIEKIQRYQTFRYLQKAQNEGSTDTATDTSNSFAELSQEDSAGVKSCVAESSVGTDIKTHQAENQV